MKSKVSVLKPIFTIILFVTISGAPSLSFAGDLSTCLGAKPVQSNRHIVWKARSNRNVAIFLVKHAQRACKDIAKLNRMRVPGDTAKSLQSIRALIAADLLDVVYKAHPDLRGLDLTDRPTPKAHHLGWISLASAKRVQDVSIKAVKSLPRDLGLIGSASPKELNDLGDAFFDLTAELGFLSVPGEAAYPVLIKEGVRRFAAKQETRTPKSDASFRSAAPPAGSVHLTTAASSRLHRFEQSLARDPSTKDQVLSIGWSLGGASKGPDDSELRRSGAGISVGAFNRVQVPPDAIQIIDGIEIIFQDSSPSHFSNRTIDYANGRFALLPK